jgi:hypothetical protein
MKQILIACSLFLAIIGPLASQNPVSKSEFEKLLSKMINDCKQGNDYTCGIGNTNQNNYADSDLNSINEAMNRQILYLTPFLDKSKAKYSSDTARAYTLLRKSRKEQGADAVNDSATAYRMIYLVIRDDKKVLDQDGQAIGKVEGFIYQMQPFKSDIVDIRMKYKEEHGKYDPTPKQNKIKYDQNRIIDILTAFYATL